MHALTRPLAVFTLALIPATAFAVGSGSGTSGGTGSGDASEPAETTTEAPATVQTPEDCTITQVWDESSEACIDRQGTGLDDDGLYRLGRALAENNEFEAAISILYMAENRDDPRVLNYLGYSHRKAGRVDIALGYYRQALRIDPDYIVARSYMGMALVLEGDLEAAEDQLLEIRARGGKGSWAETALENALFDAGFVTTY